MRKDLLDRAYAFLNEMAPTTKSTPGQVGAKTPQVSARGSMNASKAGKSANTMTRRAISTAPLGGTNV